jgi:hypothetical protein
MKPRTWRRSSAVPYLRHLPRIKHIRGTWLHRKLGDCLFSLEMWHPERALASPRVSRRPSACPWISNPVTTPLLLVAQCRLGNVLIAGTPGDEQTDDVLALLSQAPLPLLVGAFVSGAILSLTAYRLQSKAWIGSADGFLRLASERPEKNLPQYPKILSRLAKGGIAQRSEQAAHNCLVHGSNPCAPNFRGGQKWRVVTSFSCHCSSRTHHFLR